MALWYLGTIFYVKNSSSLPYFLPVPSSSSSISHCTRIQYFFYNLPFFCFFFLQYHFSPVSNAMFTSLFFPLASPLFNLDGFHRVILFTLFYQLSFSSTNLSSECLIFQRWDFASDVWWRLTGD